MDSRGSRLMLRVLSAGFAIFLLVFPILAAQDIDTDPDSPTPVLLSEASSNRALAAGDNSLRRLNLAKIESRAFMPESKIVLFVTNIELMEGEGADAFRVYIEDKEGRQYRFPVLAIEPVKRTPWIYAVTVHLHDEIGYWDPPTADGDVLLNLTWRGLTSNNVRLGLGYVGGDMKTDADALPTPYENFAAAPPASGDNIKTEKSDDPPMEEYVGYRWSGDRMRFLEQATFGPTPALDSRIRRIGLRTWLAEQFSAPYPSAGSPYPNYPLMPTNEPNTCDGYSDPNSTPPNPVDPDPYCYRNNYSQYGVQRWFFKEAFYGDSQLRHRVAWALSQLWVISGVDTQQGSHMLAYHKILSNNAFGNYRDLMKQMTLNPGMGNYLDMVRSTKISPNENYPREILQLFSIGLYKLNQNGTVQTGSPASYTQTEINNFTKVFTGWGFCNTGCPNSAPGINNYRDPMVLNQNNHNVEAKVLLDYPNAVNKNIPAGLNGNAEIDLALDNIFYHPNVAPFVSKILIQHLVASNPTPAYVGRVAAVFNNNGAGVRGDLKAVVKAILLDPEARGNNKTDPNYGKLREPVQLITNLLRTFNVRSADGTQQSDGYLADRSNRMAQNPFRSPTVFNYFTPDYIIPGTTLPGPEFQILTTGTSIARANFVNQMVYAGGVAANGATGDAPLGTSIDLSELTALATADPSNNQLLDALNQKMMHGVMSAAMRGKIMTALNVTGITPAAKAQQAVYLVATSSQYQVQR